MSVNCVVEQRQLETLLEILNSSKLSGRIQIKKQHGKIYKVFKSMKKHASVAQPGRATDL